MRYKLKDLSLTKLEYGSGAAACGFDGETRYVRITDIDENGTLNDDVVSPSQYDDKYILQNGDILFARTGATVGKTFLYDESYGKCLYAGFLIRMVPNQKIVNPYYIYYFTKSPRYLAFIEKNMKVVAQPNINAKQYGELDIDIPELGEQETVVRKLNKLSSLISLRKQQLSKLDELVKSRFIEMFGEPESNPMHWEMLPLENCLTVLGGYAFKSEEFKASGIPVLRIGNINTGVFTPTNMVYWAKDVSLERYQVLPGDLVISLTGTVGKDDYGNVCILGNAYPLYYLNQRNAKLNLGESLNKHYLSELLKFSQIKKKLTGISRGVRQANISNRDILNLVVPIPPIELQDQYAAFVEQTDKSKFEIQQSLEKLETLKKALMQKYFG